ncbi:hypothetical protein ACF1BQ_017435 [Bradyrhizobium sp. RDT10]
MRGRALEQAALAVTRIINELKGVNWVMYDVRSKPPGSW